MMPTGKREPALVGDPDLTPSPTAREDEDLLAQQDLGVDAAVEAESLVTLSRLSQCSIPAGSPSAGASTGRGLDGEVPHRRYRHPHPGRSRRLRGMPRRARPALG